MARHNIILGQDKAVRNASSAPQFGQSSQQSAYAQPDSRTQWSSGFGQQGGQAPHAPQFGGQQQEDLEAIYARPSATGHDTGRMTMRDALNAITATLGVIVVIGFVIAVTPAMLSSVGARSASVRRAAANPASVRIAGKMPCASSRKSVRVRSVSSSAPARISPRSGSVHSSRARRSS